MHVRELEQLAEEEAMLEEVELNIKPLKKKIVSAKKEQLDAMIKAEIVLLEGKTEEIKRTAGEVAAYRFFSDEIEKLQGIKPGTDLFLARKLYLQGRRPEEISDVTGIPLEVIQACVKNKASGWHLQRDRVFEGISKDLVRINTPLLREIHGTGLKLIKNSLDHRLKEADELDKPVTLAESTMIAQTLAFVSKEMRLEEADDLAKGGKALTPTEIFETFLDDPYLGPAMKRMVNKKVPIDVTPEKEGDG